MILVLLRSIGVGVCFFQLPHQTSSQERKFPPDLKRGVKKREEHEDLPFLWRSRYLMVSPSFSIHTPLLVSLTPLTGMLGKMMIEVNLMNSSGFLFCVRLFLAL